MTRYFEFVEGGRPGEVREIFPDGYTPAASPKRNAATSALREKAAETVARYERHLAKLKAQGFTDGKAKAGAEVYVPKHELAEARRVLDGAPKTGRLATVAELRESRVAKYKREGWTDADAERMADTFTRGL